MKRENVDFREALEILASRAGVSLAPPSAAQSQQAQYLDRLREINQAAALYFHNTLRDSRSGEIARTYLQGRGLDTATIDAFQIGYAVDAWDGLLTYLLGKSYTAEDVLAAGLIIEKEAEDGTERVHTYDRFRHRVMVPIRDVKGRVIGFGARALGAEQQPKYLNTPQTPLFDKSAVVFGLDAAARSIRSRGQAIIVEGYMDVLAAHQHGETNVVASMGTALTEQQLKQLKRYTETFVLALDADTAGQAATLRGITQAREALDREWVPTLTATGLVRYETRLAASLRIMTLPEGQDPDDVIRSDPGRWRELVESAQPVVDYFLDLVRQELDLNTAQGKSEAVERLAPLIQEVADEVQRAHYVQQLARMVRTDERTVQRLVVQARRRTASRQLPPDLPASPPSYYGGPAWANGGDYGSRPGRGPSTPPDRGTHCLALLLSNPELLPQLQSELMEAGASPLDEEDFSRAEERALCAALLAGAVEFDGQWPGAEPQLAPWIAILQTYARGQPNLPRQRLLDDMVDSVLRLRLTNLETRARQLPALAQDAVARGEDEEAQRYRQLMNEIGQQKRALERALNVRTLSGRRQALPDA
jgi:DNA primase